MLKLFQKSIQKSNEVAKIFQDKIPHKEIYEHENTVKMCAPLKWPMKAKPLEEIARRNRLLHQAELIVKVNRSGLMFSKKVCPNG